MPIPRLVHPVPVRVVPLAKADSAFDEDLREPMREVEGGDTIETVAQVSYNVDARSLPIGIVEGVSGYLLFLRADLEADGYAPKIGDRIVEIGNSGETLLFVVFVRDGAHYPDAGGATTRYVYFNDRRPSAQIPSMI